MSIQLPQVSDRVRVGGKLGTAVALEPRPRATIYTIAFTKGLLQKFISPPSTSEKIYSPIELLKSTDFDSPVRFYFHFEANRLSLAYEYDHLLSLIEKMENFALKPYSRLKGSLNHSVEVKIREHLEYLITFLDMSIQGKKTRVQRF